MGAQECREPSGDLKAASLKSKQLHAKANGDHNARSTNDERGLSRRNPSVALDTQVLAQAATATGWEPPSQPSDCATLDAHATEHKKKARNNVLEGLSKCTPCA